MIIETGFEQGSDEWNAARLKSIGGTGISKLITTKGVRSKSREDYIIEKASQAITGKTKSLFQTYEMVWGHTYEPDSRGIFEMVHGIKLDQCAMIFFDGSRRWHISPDGFNTEKKIGFETKSPQLKEFIATRSGNKIPTKHILQVQASLALTGFNAWYFQSYFPGLKPFTVKVERDERLIKIIKEEVRSFLRDLDSLIVELGASPPERDIHEVQAPALEDTPEWEKWVKVKEAQPHITSKMMEPTTVAQCIEAVRQVQQAVDTENSK